MGSGRTTAWRTTAARLLEGLIVVGLFALLARTAMAPLFDDLGGATLDPDRRWLSGLARVDSPAMATAMLRDIQLFVWIYAWDWHAIVTQPWALFQANVFHPAPDVLAYSEHALGKIPITGPLFALTGNAVFAYQADLLASFALSGAAMYALLRCLGTGRAAAVVGGVVYAFNPARRDFLYQPYLLTGQWFPLALLGLDRTLFAGSRRGAVLFCACLLLHLTSSYYLAYQAVFALAAYGGAVLWTTRGAVPMRGLGRAGLAAVVAVGPFVLLSLPYVYGRASGALLAYRGLAPALVLYSNDAWRSYLVPTLALLANLAPRLEQGVHAYVGIVALLLAVVGCRASARRTAAARRLGAAAVAIVAVSWVMALGPALAADGRMVLPYAVAMQWIPGFDSMRVPARFALMLMTGVAILAGLGADAVLRRVEGRRGATVAAVLAGALLVGTGVDYGLGIEAYGTRRLAVGATGPKIYRTLATLPPGPVLEVPLGGPDGLKASRYMVHSTVHWMPLLNGTSGYRPASQRVTQRASGLLPSLAGFRVLGRLTGLRYVIVHRTELPAVVEPRWRRPPGLRLIARAGDDELWEVEHRPPADLVPAMRACARGDERTCQELHARVRSLRTPPSVPPRAR